MSEESLDLSRPHAPPSPRRRAQTAPRAAHGRGNRGEEVEAPEGVAKLRVREAPDEDPGQRKRELLPCHDLAQQNHARVLVEAAQVTQGTAVGRQQVNAERRQGLDARPGGEGHAPRQGWADSGGLGSCTGSSTGGASASNSAVRVGLGCGGVNYTTPACGCPLARGRQRRARSSIMAPRSQ